MATELATRTDRINGLQRDNDQIKADLTEAQTNITAMQNCHLEMMQKIQILQDSNDQLTVHIEGIRAQCQCLTEFNLHLEIENRKLKSENCS